MTQQSPSEAPPTPHPHVTDLREHLDTKRQQARNKPTDPPPNRASRKRDEHPTSPPSGATTRDRPDPRGDKSLKRPITHTIPPPPATSHPATGHPATRRSQSTYPPPTEASRAEHQRRRHNSPTTFSPAAIAAETRSVSAREARLARHDASDSDSDSSPSPSPAREQPPPDDRAARARSRSHSRGPPQQLGRGDGGAGGSLDPPQHHTTTLPWWEPSW